MSWPKTSVVLFAYKDTEAVKRLVPIVLSSDVERVIVAFEDNSPLKDHLQALRNPRLEVSYAPQKLGKARAFNRVLPATEGFDIVFLISADVEFDPGIIDLVRARLVDPSVGVVAPRIVPSNVHNLVTRVCNILWDLHDIQLLRLSGSKDNVHGGELLAIRRDLLSQIPEDTVNEDAYMCIQAVERGFKVEYCREAIVRNTLPTTWSDLVRQRRRVNFGHYQLEKLGKRPTILTNMLFGDSKRAARIIHEFLTKHPQKVAYLPLLGALEVLSNLLARLDMLGNRDHSKWEMVKRNTHPPNSEERR